MSDVSYEIGEIVRLGYPGQEGRRGRIVEEVGSGVFAIEFDSGLAEVFTAGWFTKVGA